jgi:hypothetical protein
LGATCDCGVSGTVSNEILVIFMSSYWNSLLETALMGSAGRAGTSLGRMYVAINTESSRTLISSACFDWAP